MINGLKELSYPTVYDDFRGQYNELLNTKFLHENGIQEDFKQFCVTRSEKNVLRGIHGDAGTAKLITVFFGEIQYAFVDNREGSDTFGSVVHGTLKDTDKKSFYIPKGVGNSFLTLSDFSLYFYSQTTFYGEFEQFTLKWNDPQFNIPWKVSNPVLSERDSD